MKSRRVEQGGFITMMRWPSLKGRAGGKGTGRSNRRRGWEGISKILGTIQKCLIVPHDVTREHWEVLPEEKKRGIE